MRKVDDGEKKKKEKNVVLVATMSLPAVDHPNTDRWNADRSCQFQKVSLDVTYSTGDKFKYAESGKLVCYFI